MGDPAKKDQRLFGDIIVEREAAMPTRHEPTATTVTPFRPTPGPSGDAFARIWALGYHRLCPIIPPGAPVGERSSIFKRLARGDDPRGKMPGVKWPDGNWSGFDFVAHASTPADLPRWQAMGAGVGVKTGRGLALIDADATDPAAAAIIAATINDHFGHLPARIGRPPKAGYLIRVEDDFQYARIEFGTRDPKGRLKDRLEILYEGRQFVAHGIHPVTNKPYHWPEGMPALADVPSATAAQLLAFLAALRPLLPAAGEVVQEGAASDVPQSSLLGDMRFVRDAVALIPNSSEWFAAREDYLKMGYATRAACGPDHAAEAFELFQEWCDRWIDAENKPDIVQADWSRMKPPFKVGASWLFEQAERFSGGVFSAAAASAALWLDPAGGEPLFPEEPQAKSVSPAARIQPTYFEFPAPPSIAPRRKVYGTHYVRCYVSTTLAPTKVGKTSLIIAEALAMASGRPLLGVPVHEGPHRVWLWNGEDPAEEVDRRITAAMMHYDLTRRDLTGTDGKSRLLRDSGRDMEIMLARVGRSGAEISRETEDTLVAQIRQHEIDVVVVDPFVNSHSVPENDNGAVNEVVKAWNRIAGRSNASVELVHHTRKLSGAEATIEAGRGASALISAARSARALSQMSKEQAPRYGVEPDNAWRLFHFSDAQGNLGPPAGGSDDWMRLEGVALGNGPGEGAERFLGGDSVGVVVRVGALTSTVQTMRQDKMRGEREVIAHAAYDALAGRSVARITEIWPSVRERAGDALLQLTSERRVREKLKLVLAGQGVAIERDGQIVNLSVAQAGTGEKAPWCVYAKAADRGGQSDALTNASDRSDEHGQS